MDKETFQESLRPSIIQCSRGKHFGPEILHGLIEKESNYRIHAHSPTGVHGLCQITRSTFSYVVKKNALNLAESTNIYDPQVQLVVSSSYLETLMRRSYVEHPGFSREQHLTFALQAYNSGYSTVQKAFHKGGVKGYKHFLPSSSDRNYAEVVLKNSAEWKQPTQQVVVHNSNSDSNHIAWGNLSCIGLLILGGCYLYKLTKKLLNL